MHSSQWESLLRRNLKIDSPGPGVVWFSFITHQPKEVEYCVIYQMKEYTSSLSIDTQQ